MLLASYLNSLLVKSFFSGAGIRLVLHSFPTRRSSDPHNPLTDKVIAGVYPPGSTFKPVVALAALEAGARSEEHTSELQSRPHLVRRLLHEKQNHEPVRGRDRCCSCSCPTSCPASHPNP